MKPQQEDRGEANSTVEIVEASKVSGEKTNVQYYTLQTKLLQNQSYTEFQEVIPNLFIGGQISSINLIKLQQANIKHVLRVNGITQNLLPYEKYGINCKVLDLDDMPDFDPEPFFEEAQEYIQRGLSTGEGVLVVCTAGISRSAAIVMSYLIKQKKMSYQKAYDTVKQARIFIQPNIGFQRVLQGYATKYACELCDLQKKTHWFEQYAKKRFTSQLFRVVECDSCECPMIVYIASHKQNLTTEELLEAFNLCEDVGNDKFGQGRWFIEGKQRKIHDHFHWHVRELKVVNDILAIRLLGIDPIIGERAIEETDFCVDMIKQKSIELLEKQIGSESVKKGYQILEKRVQRGLADLPPTSIQNQKVVIESHIRFSFEGKLAIEQTVLLLSLNDLSKKVGSKGVYQAQLIPHVLSTIYYRVLVNKKEGMPNEHFLAKL